MPPEPSPHMNIFNLMDVAITPHQDIALLSWTLFPQVVRLTELLRVPPIDFAFPIFGSELLGYK